LFQTRHVADARRDTQVEMFRQQLARIREQEFKRREMRVLAS
jgi:hypothetical protein